MNTTTAPRGVRLIITLTGRRNAGKSSLINALVDQEVAIVSGHPGTTTDPVGKHYELHPIGPVTFFDTAGLDDYGTVGLQRMAATRKVLRRTDIAMLVVTEQGMQQEEKRLLKELSDMNLPVIVVFNKTDLTTPCQEDLEACSGHSIVTVSATTGENIEELKRFIIATAPKEMIEDPLLVSDMVKPKQTVLLVAPIDGAAPKGRLILPQVQVLRDVLDANALALTSHKEHSSWYQDQSLSLADFLQRNVEPFNQPSGIKYRTEDAKSELFDKLKQLYKHVLSERYAIVNTGLKPENEAILRKIDKLTGFRTETLPQISMIMVTADSGRKQLFTLLRNNAHKNISSLFNEEANRLPKQDNLTLVRGVLGSYPAVFLQLKESEIAQFYNLLSKLDSEQDYVNLLNKFAVRRSSPQFWPFSDAISDWYKQDQPVEFGLLDYNRFENR